MGGTAQHPGSLSQRRDSCHSWQRVSSGGSWQSLGMESCPGDQPWQSGWQPQRRDSQLSTDSRERAEQARGTAYSPEEGAVWISRRTTRKVTNRSQQTSRAWSQKAPAESMKCLAQKSASSVGAETGSVKGVGKEIPDTCPETTSQPARQGSRRGSQVAPGQGSWCGSEKVPGWDSRCGSQRVSVQESRRGSQEVPGWDSWHGSQQFSAPESRRGSRQVSGQESWWSSQHSLGRESWWSSQQTFGQESRHSSQKVPEQQSQPQQPGEKKSELSEKPSDSGLLLVLQLQCNNLQGIEVLVEEQAAKPWRTRSQERVEGGTLRLSQGSTAEQGEAWHTFNLFSQEGGTWTGRTGKILISCDEETGNTVIQRIHETSQHPPGQPSQSEGATSVPKECGGAAAEKPKVVGQGPWHSGGTDRGGEAASELPAASRSPGGLLSMAVAVEMVHEAQQTHSVITLDEGLWVRRRTGKLLQDKSQQTSISALRKSSSAVQEQRGGGGSTSGQREGGKPQNCPSELDVPELPGRTSSRSSQLSGHD
ncbi:fibrous sheath cabyr-binding protein [Limosa lapponica baueri]|uniref:Fibrous sheath cabyr-binding protein n=1 Tax=Limosa lapponica baueri TaxID=1758121 RepID=A0A2I0T9V5_LIMLA|nr:fibrous sheath cabyr-binding protein [Limosa lapponica baueri]